MVEAVLEHLVHVVVRDEVGEPLARVVVEAVDPVGVFDAGPAGEVLDEQTRGAQLGIAARAADPRTAGVAGSEALQVPGLDGEVELVFGRAHQLVDEVFHRQARRAARDLAVKLHEALHDGEVLRDLLDHARALHLHRHDPPASRQHGTVHLRDGGRPQRRVVEFGKGLLQRAAQLGGHFLLHHIESQRLALGAQRPEGLAVLDGQHVRMRRGDLTELDEGGAEVFEHGDGLLGGQALVDPVPAQHLQYLEKARGGVALVLGRRLAARACEQVLERGHVHVLSGGGIRYDVPRL